MHGKLFLIPYPQPHVFGLVLISAYLVVVFSLLNRESRLRLSAE